MPIYEYRCANGHEFEVFQNMSEDPVSRCQECGAPVERVFHPVAVHFKGSGFYTTDYARAGKGGSSDGAAKPDSKDGSGAGKDSDSKSSESEGKADSSKKEAASN